MRLLRDRDSERGEDLRDGGVEKSICGVGAPSTQPVEVEQLLIPACRAFALIALFLLALSSALCAQTVRQLRGTIEDTSHAAIAGAEIVLDQGSQKRHVSSGPDGRFTLDSVTQNSAEITVSAPGFAATHRSLEAGNADLEFSVVLEPASVSTQLEVTASRTPLPASETPDSVQLLTSAQLQTSGALETDDMLRQVAGFDLFRRNSSRTANPTTQGASLRGIGSSGASRALILLDGVPITDPFGGWVNWSQVPRAAIENVEIVRGGASDLYGGQALSGVVQLLSKAPEGTDATLDLSYGNQSTPNASGFIGRAFGQWITSAAAEYFRTAGYTPVEPQQRGAVDNSAESLHRTGELQAQRQLSQHSRLFLRGLGYDDSRHNGTIIEVNRTRSWQAAAGFDWEGHSGDLLQVRGYGGAEDYHQTFATVAANRNSETLARVQAVPSRFWGVSAQYSRNLGTRNSVLAGTDFSRVNGESDDEILTAAKPSSQVNAGGINRSAGFFVEDIAHVTQRWIVTGVFRFDDWQTVTGFNRTTSFPSQQQTATAFPDRSETSFAPKLATKYQVNNVLSLRASAYRSFRSPTLNELYRSFRLGNVLTVSNQQLRAERLTGVEAGPAESFLNGKLLLQQRFFWAEVHRPIANVTQSTTPSLITRMRENLGSTRATGVEAQADLELLKYTGVSAQYQFVDAQVTSFPANPALIGLQVPEVPRHEFTFQAHYADPRLLTLAVQGRNSSSVFDDDQNTLLLDSYFKLDLFVSRRLNSWMDIYAAGENLLNQHFMIARTPIITLGSPFVGRIGVQLHVRR